MACQRQQCLLQKNKKVIGVDINKDIIKIINDGQVHFVEPELRSLVSSAVVAGNLKATFTVEPADAFIIAVPTPLHVGSNNLQNRILPLLNRWPKKLRLS